ncbi:hypothetical protein L288_16010 [Sphingobium quisquiliarum P25]|uniref:Methylated-DNA--protein-cysteine methyltransferase n=1 Tax=Sphingobium quisquiliarum P25 TaxID=1329909 RepID=T0GPQ7_9SPHN|nr:methylated-DNA--[protein]-cysteine S-methyltransferase [Sphingobium quisquiliarum]EQB02677.1 hypothetical protein L288_16010 [Sphingobium quisquiliarum P25]
MACAFGTFSSPVGQLTMVASEQGLTALLWEDDAPNRVRWERGVEDSGLPLFTEASRQLSQYFDGHRTSFDLPLDFRGTDFQKAVWSALLQIPFGETRTYAQIAHAIGRPSACRAVGAANGRNPLSIIAPCHRVIGSGGALTGFAGGLDVKRQLLDHEREVALSKSLA